MKKMRCFILFLIAANAYGERPSNEIPMYGGQHDPKVERSEESSKSAARLGWKYYYNGDLDTAIKRFNQAWMFDRENPEAYWGFGLIIGRRASEGDVEKNLKESIRFLTMAHERDTRNGRILGDLAFSHTLLGQFLKSNGKDGEKDFSIAENLFQKANELDSKYPPIAYNWSVLKFYRGDFKSAKEHLEQAKVLGYEPDPAYVKDLQGKIK